MSEQFDIIFRGDIVFGHQLADVKIKLQQLFKADATKIESLFTGRPVPLKRNLDLNSAQKYRDALTRAGAQVELTASVVPGTSSSTQTAPQPKPQSTARSQTQSHAKPVSHPVESAKIIREDEKSRAENWTLAPAGSDLLLSTEKRSVVPVAVDISALSLRAEGGNLLDRNEQQPAAVANVVAPDFSLAEVGADLISANEKMKLPLVEIEIEDWTIAETGSDLISESEKSITPTPVIQSLNVSLAPAGADLGQIKPVVKPIVPDISGIRLAD